MIGKSPAHSDVFIHSWSVSIMLQIICGSTESGKRLVCDRTQREMTWHILVYLVNCTLDETKYLAGYFCAAWFAKEAQKFCYQQQESNFLVFQTLHHRCCLGGRMVPSRLWAAGAACWLLGWRTVIWLRVMAKSVTQSVSV